MKRVKSHSCVERHVASMFDNSLFADLSLGFIHPSYPFTMRFEVHKSVVSQSSFFKNLICNMQYLPTQENAIENNNATSKDYDETSQSNILTIHLARALSHCGFVLAPFQHIIRRKWQKAQSKSTTVVQQSSSSATSTAVKPLGHHILASHIRFALRWMYIYDRQQMIQSLEDDDTLRVLAIAILFDLDDLATACVNKYINEQLCMTTIMRDLEHICQLPRDHHAYLQLRDASLLLLLRYGANEPENLSDLPVDYMADVLSADMLFVGCEYDRYFLIREVLSIFMRSVGKITWTRSGPVDQDRKRLSGFVRPAPITSSVVRSRKRKRIPSEELLSTSSATDHRHATKMARLSFSATVPFESLVADASSGGIIDKATVLSHLLKTTVNYSNMTFDQLTKVRQDGIVDDDIVFRALWQREAFERLLLPTRLNKTDSSDDDDDENDQVDGEERQEALDDYFDVGSGASDDRRRQLLLGTPKYRLCMSVELSSPSHENGWVCDACDMCNTGSPSPPVTVFDKEGYNEDDNNNTNEMDIEQEEYSIKPSQQMPLKEQQKQDQTNEDGLDVKEGEEIEEKINLNEDDDEDDDYEDDDYEDDDDEMGDRKVGELAVAISPSSPKTPKQPVRLTPTSTMLGDLSLASQSKFRDEPNQQHDDTEQQQEYRQRRPSSSKKHDQQIIWQKKFYSQPEMIWGTMYRVQIEAQVVPHHLLHIEDDDDDDSYYNSNNDNSTKSENHKHKSSLLCRFELQRSGLPLQQQHNNNEEDDASSFLSVTQREKSHLSVLSDVSSEGVSSSQPTTLHCRTGSTVQQQRLPVLRRRCSAPSQFISSMPPKQPRIRYTIHCLNQQEGVIENDRVDPEDRILLPVTDQTEGEDRNVTGYVGQVQIDGYNSQELTKIDTVICLEVFGFNRTVR
ncbi:hypothetical protein BDC45DRAFT_497777 [Circinella umbellata]|nr:hypothetical protein BDC45DRAFT_497777 [Circinella umbellata]